MVDTPTYCMVSMVPVDECPHCFDVRDAEGPVVAFFRKLFCHHTYVSVELYKGFELVPDTLGGGFSAMKEHRRCPKCNRLSVKTLYLI